MYKDNIMLNMEDKNFVNEVCKLEVKLDVKNWRERKAIGMKFIVSPGQDWRNGIYEMAFLRNASEAEKYVLDDRVYTRLGFQDPAEEYNSNSGKGRHWKDINFSELIEFIRDSIKNEEFFNSVIVNGIRYNNVIFESREGKVVLRYEWSRKNNL